MIRMAKMLPVLGLALACDRPVATPEPPALVEAPVEVHTTVVTEHEIADTIHGTGTIKAHRTTLLGPLVDGVVEAVLVDVGDRVAAGQALFRTRQIDYRLQVEQREALVRLAEEEVGKAARDLERAEELRRGKVVPEDRLDTVATGHRIAVARLQRARVELAQATQDLQDTVVVAPYAGVITRRSVDQGTFMRAMAGGAGAVMQIMKVDIVVAVVHVPEITLPRIRLGTPAVVRVDGLDREFPSRVEIINDLVDESSHAVELRLPIENTDLGIKPGLFAKVELRAASRTALALDRSSVLGTGENNWVLVEEQGRAVRRAVRVRDIDRQRVEVMAGLQAGDNVLSGNRLHALEAGSRIVVQVSDVDL
jgi:RND family efflux transporter MFP subunit